MKAHILAIPLALASFTACAMPSAEDDGPSTGESDGLSRGGVFDPGGIVLQPDYCAGATGTITASATSLTFGQTMTLTWSVNVPANCTSSVKLNGEVVSATGTKVVKPLANYSYVLSIGNKTLSYATVNVTLPSTVYISGNTDEWKALLVQAVGTPNTRVVLQPGVDMDLSGYQNIYVRQGVTLTSEKPAVFLEAVGFTKGAPEFGLPKAPGRDARTPGPRLYTNTLPKPLFLVRCADPGGIWGDNVKINGFRLQGPHYETMEGDENLERGIMIESCTGVDVSNMEISGFSGQAVYVSDSLQRQVGPSAVRVHDNYIHNNQHEGGNGYGVDVASSAWVTIDRNVFDYNRHAIAASGKEGTSYIADHNLVLKGGGVHNKWYNHYTHLFDVHGDANCDYLPGEWAEHIWNCGNAGSYFEFTNNAFQFTNDHAIKLRGVPRQKAKISGNVFAHSSADDAIEPFNSTNVEIGANTANVDPFGKYGVCDFDGDGTDDLFLATGTSWWYSSGGKGHWTFLSPNNERLEQVGLGDFDGDKRCDVVARNTGTGGLEISKSGTGAWTSLGISGVAFNELRFADFNGDKRTDIFRRAPDGQWSFISPGVTAWTNLASSSIPLADLRFGDFNGDGVTDVLKINGSGYQVSLGGALSWQEWSSLTDDPASFLIADVDGTPGEDFVRYVATSPIAGRWEVASQGRYAWKTFATMTWANTAAMLALKPAHTVRSLVGRFRGLAKEDLLAIDFTRWGQTAGNGSTSFVGHSRHPY